jgi:hypothetical protein
MRPRSIIGSLVVAAVVAAVVSSSGAVPASAHAVAYQGPTTQQSITKAVTAQANNTSTTTNSSTSAYVALGDSYSSGEGNPPFTGGTCDRSQQAYPQLLQDQLHYGTFYFLACSGATIPQLPGQADEVPKAVRGTVRLVTFTIGGNDLYFSNVIEQCVVDHVLDDGTCTGPHAVGGLNTQSESQVEQLASRGLSNLNRQLPGVLRVLGRTFPKAHIVVLGYPQLFPPVLADQATNFDCSHLRIVNVPVAAGAFAGQDIHWFDNETALLNNSLRLNVEHTALAGNAYHGAQFVLPADYPPSFNGHNACSTASWFTPIYSGQDERFSLHPNAEGQEALAAVLRAYFVHAGFGSAAP